VTAVRGIQAGAKLGSAVGPRCHRMARVEGLAPALTLLRSAVLPGLLPCGPGGHAVVPAGIGADAGRIWLDGVTFDPATGRHTRLEHFDLPGGRVVALRCSACPAGGVASDSERAAWALGLVWLRLGLSEALREECLRYLRGRRSGESALVHQQLVKGALAAALAEHLEVRAVLSGAEPGDLPPAVLAGLHALITGTDRAQLRLLGGSSMLTGGPGEVAHVSELVADAYPPEQR
jgi:hypothetical protein